MGNCNTRLLFRSSQANMRAGATAAPAEDGAYYEGSNSQSLRSTLSEESTYIIFENQTDTPVKLFWLNYEGHEIPYRSIEPGRSHRQQTFITHPWTFKSCVPEAREVKLTEDVVVDHRRIVFPNKENKKVVLRKPSVWRWSPENHQKLFPKKFIVSTQSFLLSYNTLRRKYIEAMSSRSRSSSFSERRLSRCSSNDDIDLGVFPPEIILRVIELAAPQIPYILPPDVVNTEDGNRV